MNFTIYGGTLIDGTGADPVPGATIRVEAGRIAGVETSQRSDDGVAIDAAGLTLLPGLIDAHAHLGIVTPRDPNVPPAITAARIFRNCELALDAGFTTVRDNGGVDGGVVQAIELGLVRGPRIYPAGPVLCQTGGHGDLSPPFGHHDHGSTGVPGLSVMSLPCDGPGNVRLAARTAFRRGATHLKVIVNGGFISLTRLEDTQFTVPELMAAVAEADARDTYVTAHAHEVRAIRNALQAGVGCFEHGTFLDADTAAALADAGAFLVPTFAVMRVIRDEWRSMGLTEEMLSRLDEVEQATAASLKLAREAGVVIGLGSDLIGYEQQRRGLELAIRARLEDPMTAIVSATAVNAQILRCGNERGTVEVGKRADLILVDGDPLAAPDIFDNPEHVVLVMKDGFVVKNELGVVRESRDVAVPVAGRD